MIALSPALRYRKSEKPPSVFTCDSVPIFLKFQIVDTLRNRSSRRLRASSLLVTYPLPFLNDSRVQAATGSSTPSMPTGWRATYVHGLAFMPLAIGSAETAPIAPHGRQACSKRDVSTPASPRSVNCPTPLTVSVYALVRPNSPGTSTSATAEQPALNAKPIAAMPIVPS